MGKYFTDCKAKECSLPKPAQAANDLLNRFGLRGGKQTSYASIPYGYKPLIGGVEPGSVNMLAVVIISLRLLWVSIQMRESLTG